MGSDGFEKVLIGTLGPRETFLGGAKERAAQNTLGASGAKPTRACVPRTVNGTGQTQISGFPLERVGDAQKTRKAQNRKPNSLILKGKINLAFGRWFGFVSVFCKIRA